MEPDLTSLFQPQILDRGYAYYLEGTVQDLQQTATQIGHPNYRAGHGVAALYYYDSPARQHRGGDDLRLSVRGPG